MDINGIAGITPGASGADLANLVNMAAVVASKQGAEHVKSQDLLEALETLEMGRMELTWLGTCWLTMCLASVRMYNVRGGSEELHHDSKGGEEHGLPRVRARYHGRLDARVRPHLQGHHRASRESSRHGW